MNRRERKLVEKQLGLHKERKHETRTAKFQRWRDNMESGKRMEEDMRTTRETMIQEQDDQKMEDVIQSMADFKVKTKNMNEVDALVEAQEEYANSKQ